MSNYTCAECGKVYDIADGTDSCDLCGPVFSMAKQIEQLQAELAAARQQVVPWRKGGAKGGDRSGIIPTDDYLVDAGQGCIVANGGTLGYFFQNVIRYVPLSDFPLPE